MPVRIVRNPPLSGALVTALVDVWVTVTNAGGAVGFVPPVTAADVEPTAEAAFARVRAGRDDLVVAFDGPAPADATTTALANASAAADAPAADDAPAVASAVAPVGFGFLATHDTPIKRHWGLILRLQRLPDRAGQGVGGAMLDELEAAARDRGLERVALTVRGGTGTDAFYLRRGYTLDGVLAGRLIVAGERVVDELHLSKWIGPAPEHARAGVLAVKRLDPDLPLPRYAHPGDAGLDLHAAETVTLAPGERVLVPTGLAIALPPGHVGLVHPRSGLAIRAGVGMVNAPGTVDEGYRGELKVILVNHDPREPVTLQRGDRIAQLVVQRVEHLQVVEVDELPDSRRGDGGFGSSGR